MWQTGKCLYICEFLPPGPSYFCVFRPSVNGHVCKIRKLHEQPQKREIDEIFHVGAHAHMCARYEVSMIKPFNLEDCSQITLMLMPTQTLMMMTTTTHNRQFVII